MSKNLKDKTISDHINNVSFFINKYLMYYEVIKAEDGISEVYDFLDDFFIRKCLWSTSKRLKSEAASIKKFYTFMNEKGYTTDEDLKELKEMLKDNMETFIDDVNRYNNPEEDYFLF